MLSMLACMVLVRAHTMAQLECPVLQEEPKCGSHEIGINLFSWINLAPKTIDDHVGDVSYANGLLYKLHCRQNVLRLGADVFRFDYQDGQRPADNGPYPWYYYTKGHFTTFEFRFGYERRLNRRKLQLFIGTDLCFRYVEQEGIFEGFGDFGPPYSFSGRTCSHSEQFLIAPLFGLNYRPFERFSLSIETSYAVGYSTTTDEINGHMDRNVMGFLNPLRAVCLSYHFPTPAGFPDERRKRVGK